MPQGYKDSTQETLLDYQLANLGSAANQFYVALYTVAPTASTEGTEVSGGSYARQLVNFSRTDQTIDNDAQFQFPEATADWGTITYWALHSSVSGTGNQVFYAPLGTSRTVLTGDILTVEAAQCTQTFSN